MNALCRAISPCRQPVWWSLLLCLVQETFDRPLTPCSLHVDKVKSWMCVFLGLALFFVVHTYVYVRCLIHLEEKKAFHDVRIVRVAVTSLPVEAEIAQSVVCWAHCPAWYSVVGLIFLWTSGRGDFLLWINMGFDSIPLKLFWMRE